MTQPNDQPTEEPVQKVQFYVTTGYTCGYKPTKMAQSLIATPQHLVDTDIYSQLITQGFRRSGLHVYRPHCENCQACIPARVPVGTFQISRSQKRAFKLHKNLTTTILPIGFHQAHFDLYTTYQAARHEDPEIEDKDLDTPEDKEENAVTQYKNFICQSHTDSVLVEFKEDGVLKMVSVIDLVEDGISAVYTFYDTSNPKASYGTYNVIWQINWAASHHFEYVYLGYWIEDNAKMAYKNNFQPLEKYINGQWLLASTP
jgi:arginyl-tRNA--protein-N-Asp/Glu arginylyltransferase